MMMRHVTKSFQIASMNMTTSSGYFNHISVPVTRSESNKAPLGCGRNGDTVYKYKYVSSLYVLII